MLIYIYVYNLGANMEEQYDVSYNNSNNLIRRFLTINKLLIAVNVIVFLVMSIDGDTNNAYYLYEHGGVSPHKLFVEFDIASLFTSMFIHAGISHLINNMLMLWLMGDVLERELGKIYYIIVYMGSGLAPDAPTLTIYCLPWIK